MVDGEVFIADRALDEDDQVHRRLIRVQETGRVEIHAAREVRWTRVDVAGMRPIVILSLLKRFLSHDGFSVRLVYGRPDLGSGAYDCAGRYECGLERPSFVCEADMRTLGLQPPDSQPPMDRCTTSACHAMLTDASITEKPWVHGWDLGNPALLAALFVEWEISGGEQETYIPLEDVLAVFGSHAVLVYLMGTHYGELLPPIEDGLRTAATSVQRIHRVFHTLRPGLSSPSGLACHREAFEDALADDLDTPTALLCVFDWILEAERSKTPVGDRDLREMLGVLGMSDLAPGTPPARERCASPPARAGGSPYASGPTRAKNASGRPPWGPPGSTRRSGRGRA